SRNTKGLSDWPCSTVRHWRLRPLRWYSSTRKRYHRQGSPPSGEINGSCPPASASPHSSTSPWAAERMREVGVSSTQRARRNRLKVRYINHRAAAELSARAR